MIIVVAWLAGYRAGLKKNVHRRKNAHAVAMVKRRNLTLGLERRSEIASEAAKARWAKRKARP